MTAGEEGGIGIMPSGESKRVEGVKRTPYERDADEGDGDLSIPCSVVLKSARSSRDGGTVEFAAQIGVPPLGLPSSELKVFRPRVESPEVGIGAGGKVGTGGGVSLWKPFRVAEGERDRRLKNDLFFLPAASER